MRDASPSASLQSALRRGLVVIYFCTAVILVIAGLNGWDSAEPWRRAGVVTLGITCVLLGLGLKQAREWARLSSGALCLIVAGVEVWYEATGVQAWGWDLARAMVLRSLVYVIPWLAVAVYSFLPSTRAHFADAHNARAGSVAQR